MPLMSSSHRPMMNAPTTAPGIEPMPPKTAATNAFRPGMPPEVLAHIFEPFYRAGSAKGCGLGLPLARRAAALCGGRIDAESAPGRGSLCTVWLPFAEEVP